ncbi:hypothetical protein DICPUDRAFT_158192 [Dictyostelium purpureum]|uniref:Uncharacterized protein n=1 Tax=Dictyostelium purpureum TaxID=5786 RepID=F1A116_DICPU|nr:uncharacterized protein DICPUDRAFT_158192 [Dictyostelium purpureum]EGC30111.1 hypothetical protein DICPUDRAFT_158192 [Dictyostelium purpureum]|eukprot:XP_003293363.1 hypothetical protein DICPUDRAFT_158192 [Dictyostelium purpureum]
MNTSKRNLIVGEIFVGFFFGFAIQKCNVYLPSIVRDQMEIKNFTMIKIILSFISASTISTTLLNYFRMIKLEFLPIIYRRNLIGGILMGVGIYVCGACPGIALPQVPIFYSSIFTIIGGIVGGVVYGYCDPYVQKKFPAQKQSFSTIFQYFNVSMQTITIPFVILNIIALYFLEQWYPSQIESSNKTTIFGSLTNQIWSPIVSGTIMGLMQIPSYLISGVDIGASSAYVSIGAFFLKKYTPLENYFKTFLKSPKTYQILFDFGALLGSFASSLFNPPPKNYPTTNVGTIVVNLIGGFLIIFGARFADGCTSGSISAMSKTEIGSFITLSSVFFGGILFCYIFNSL